MTSDEARVLVNVPPAVSVAPVPQLALIGDRVSRTLTAQVSDTGLALDHDPDATATTSLAFRWRQASGPKMVLDGSDRAEATVTFTNRGIYELELTAENGRCAAIVPLRIVVNQRPEVDAGARQTVTLSAAGTAEVRLQGRVTTGLGDPKDTLDIQWEAPGVGSDVVTFSAPTQPVTTATFTAGGVYKLRLTAINRHTLISESTPLSASAEVEITVNQQPVVDAGPDLEITLPARAALDGTVSDDGLPNAAVTVGWSQVSGPGQVVFADAKSEYTMASFSKPGVYVLRLMANDGAAEASDETTITVSPSPRVTDDLQVLYTFQEGQGSLVVKDLSGAGDAIDLMIEAKDKDKIVWGPGGRVLTVKGVSAIASPSPAAKLINAIRGSKATKGTHAVTIEAWIKPAQIKYPAEGLPARIVTLSADSEKRNFTLGQVDGTYRVRLRTSGNDDLNGERNALQAGTVDTTKVGHLVYTWEAASGIAVLYQDGKKVAEKRVSGNLSNWGDYRLALGNECTGERAWLGEYHLVAVYGRALSRDEVQRNFGAGPNP
jgi:PKD repeat protein